MATLQIRLLGEFALVCKGQPVTAVDSSRQQSLLAYLLLHSDAPQLRQRLAFLFWPDSSETQARTNLRNLLYTLVKALPEGERFICTEGQTVQWCNSSDAGLDVAEFRAAIREARSLADEGAIERYRQAVELYRGELLPGCYDDWVAEERERLAQEYGDALQRLIALLEVAGDYRAAINYAGRLVRHDPLREETYRQIFRLYWQCGDRGGIKKAYKDCEIRLRTELDVEPSPETRRAYEKYLRKELPARGDGATDDSGAGLEGSRLASDGPGSAGTSLSAATLTPESPAGAGQSNPPALGKPGRRAPSLLGPRLRSGRWSQQGRTRAAKNALFALNVAAPLATLGALVFLVQAPVELAAGASALLYAGLYFVFNPRTPAEEARNDNVVEARDKLARSKQRTERTRLAAGRLQPGEAQARVLRICDLADQIIERLAAEKPPRLPSAARMEHITAETGDTLDAYLQIEQEELHAPAARLADLRNDIAGVFRQIENSLQDIVITLDEGKMTELEVRIRVLTHTLRDGGLG